jgi:hypothetical protein
VSRLWKTVIIAELDENCCGWGKGMVRKKKKAVNIWRLKLLPDDWWRQRWLRTLSACCSELETVYIYELLRWLVVTSCKCPINPVTNTSHSYTVHLLSSLKVRDEVSHSYKTRGNYSFLSLINYGSI